MPSVPRKDELLFDLAKKGYWVFFPRYRGTWESDGNFLAKSPHLDIKDVIDGINTGLKVLYWKGETYKLKPTKLFLIGSSFGGPAVLLNAHDKRVTKVVAISPVVGWKTQAKSKGEPWDPLTKFVREAFGNGYRFTDKNWQKLKRGSFYDPSSKANKIPGKKILIIHAKDDDIVDYKPVEKFAKKINCKLKLLKRGGHSITSISKPASWKRVEKFIK